MGSESASNGKAGEAVVISHHCNDNIETISFPSCILCTDQQLEWSKILVSTYLSPVTTEIPTDI